MKRATFKKPFNGMDNALKLIPESYKVDGNEFEITDGIETYRVRWESDLNEGTVTRAENKNLINEDMQKIKHLMGFKSEDTLGTLKGQERIAENASFNDVLGKTKKLLSESEETEGEVINEAGHAAGLGFSNEGNLEGNAPIAEMERELEEGEVSEDAVEENSVDESDDVDNYMNAMGHNKKLGSLAAKINTRDEKVEAALDFVRDLTGGDEAITQKVARLLMKGDVTADAAAAGAEMNMNESVDENIEEDVNEAECNECGEEMMEEADRFNEIFDGMYENVDEDVSEDVNEECADELTDKQSKEMDTDKDGDIDAKDLKNLRDKE